MLETPSKLKALGLNARRQGPHSCASFEKGNVLPMGTFNDSMALGIWHNSSRMVKDISRKLRCEVVTR